MELRVKKNHTEAIMPKFAHDNDTGFDLFTCQPTEIAVNGKTIARTGLIFDLPPGWGIQVRNRSGMTVKGVPSFKKTMTINDNGIIEYRYEETRADITVYLGTIDQGYRGEVGIMVKNNENFDVVIPQGTKLAQGVLERVYHCEFIETEEVGNTERGTGGFGSSEIKEGK